MGDRTFNKNSGFTLIELSMVILVAAIIVGTATPAYFYLVDKARTNKTIDEIKEMQRDINRYNRKNIHFPDSLAEIYPIPPFDPWGRPYQFLNIKNAPNPGAINPRTDKSFKRLNADYDLYSQGSDAVSLSPTGASESRDDIIRGKNGDLIGISIDY